MTSAKSFKLTPHHGGLSVPNLEASIAWYRDILGFDLEKTGEIPPAHARYAFLARDAFRIELIEVAGAHPMPDDRRYPNQDIATHGTKHLAFIVEDLRGLLANLKEKGVDVAMDLFEIDNSYVTFIRDNSGILIELIEIRETG